MGNKAANRNRNHCVRNLQGTTDVVRGGERWKRVCRCGNWMNHWRAGYLIHFPFANPARFLEPPCFVRGCAQAGCVGAHVLEVDGRATQNWKIVPFCKAHNHHSFTQEVFLKSEAVLVAAGQAGTCTTTDEWRLAVQVVKLYRADLILDPDG